MAQIARAFVDGIEFRGGTWQNIDTLSMIKKSISSIVNVLIYVSMRDAKLLELRSKLETEPSAYKGQKVEFLFKINKLSNHLNFIGYLLVFILLKS